MDSVDQDAWPQQCFIYIWFICYPDNQANSIRLCLLSGCHRVIPIPGCGLCSLSHSPIANVACLTSIKNIVAMPWNIRIFQSSTRLASFLPIPAAPRSRPAPPHKGACATLRRHSADSYSLTAPVQTSRYMALSTRARATLPGKGIPSAAPSSDPNPPCDN